MALEHSPHFCLCTSEMYFPRVLFGPLCIRARILNKIVFLKVQDRVYLEVSHSHGKT